MASLLFFNIALMGSFWFVVTLTADGVVYGITLLTSIGGSPTATAIVFGTLRYVSVFLAPGMLEAVLFFGGKVARYPLWGLSWRSRVFPSPKVNLPLHSLPPLVQAHNPVLHPAQPIPQPTSPCVATVLPTDKSLGEFSTPEKSRRQTPTDGLSDDDQPAPESRQSHLVLMTHIPGSTLRNRPGAGKHVKAVFMLKEDGLYHQGKRVEGDANPAESQLRRSHRVDYANRCVERKRQQTDCYATGVLLELKTGNAMECLHRLELRLNGAPQKPGLLGKRKPTASAKNKARLRKTPAPTLQDDLMLPHPTMSADSSSGSSPGSQTTPELVEAAPPEDQIPQEVPGPTSRRPFGSTVHYKPDDYPTRMGATVQDLMTRHGMRRNST